MNLVINENCYNFIMQQYKVLQTTIAMITEDKVTDLFLLFNMRLYAEFIKLQN